MKFMTTIHVQGDHAQQTFLIKARSSKGRELNFHTTKLDELLDEFSSVFPDFLRKATEINLKLGNAFDFNGEMSDLAEESLFKTLSDIQCSSPVGEPPVTPH